jgi:hypothetical protein
VNPRRASLPTTRPRDVTSGRFSLKASRLAAGAALPTARALAQAGQALRPVRAGSYLLREHIV